MPPLAGLVNALATLVVVAFVGRAAAKLLGNPEVPHRELVSTRERHATTLAGVPLSLVALSTMADGPLAAPYDPLPLLFAGVVLAVYPDFAPSVLD